MFLRCLIVFLITSTLHFISGQRFTALTPPIKPNWCTIETLNTECTVGGAGSSGRILVSVSRNGSRILELHNNHTNDFGVLSQIVSLSFKDYGPGSYELECGDGEYPSKSFFDVHDAHEVAPDFEKRSGHETVNFKAGERSRRLVCDVAGEPKAAAPDISWSYPTGLGLSTANLGYEADLARPPRAGEWAVRCTATNCYGKIATKEFTVKVHPEGEGGEFSGGARGAGSSTIAPTIAVAVLILTMCEKQYPMNKGIPQQQRERCSVTKFKNSSFQNLPDMPSANTD